MQLDWKFVKRIFRYLQGTKTMKLCFSKGELVVKGFSNANFVGDQDNCKSTSGHVLHFGGAVVSSSSKKQICITRFSMKAEHIACSMATTYAVWIGHFIEELKLDLLNKPINVF